LCSSHHYPRKTDSRRNNVIIIPASIVIYPKILPIETPIPFKF